VFSSIRRSRSY